MLAKPIPIGTNLHVLLFIVCCWEKKELTTFARYSQARWKEVVSGSTNCSGKRHGVGRGDGHGDGHGDGDIGKILADSDV